jgi:hypothetical protein
VSVLTTENLRRKKPRTIPRPGDKEVTGTPTKHADGSVTARGHAALLAYYIEQGGSLDE